jgi:hypothetical protein
VLICNSGFGGHVGVATQIGQKLEALVRNKRNRTIRFQKSDPPILLGLIVVRDAVRFRWGVSTPAKRRLNEEEA